MSIGNRLRLLRDERRYTQIEAAKMLNLNNKTLSDYERGITEPDIDTIKQMALLYRVTIDYLLEFSDRRYPESITNERQKLIEELSDVQFAFYDELIDLSDEQLRELVEFARFLKSRNQFK